MFVALLGGGIALLVLAATVDRLKRFTGPGTWGLELSPLSAEAAVDVTAEVAAELRRQGITDPDATRFAAAKAFTVARENQAQGAAWKRVVEHAAKQGVNTALALWSERTLRTGQPSDGDQQLRTEPSIEGAARRARGDSQDEPVGQAPVSPDDSELAPGESESSSATGAEPSDKDDPAAEAARADANNTEREVDGDPRPSLPD